MILLIICAIVIITLYSMTSNYVAVEISIKYIRICNREKQCICELYLAYIKPFIEFNDIFIGVELEWPT